MLDSPRLRTILDRLSDAPCRGVPLSVFFPEVGETYDEAREVCQRCPAATWSVCLEYAELTEGGGGPAHGYLAGFTPAERRREWAARRTG